MIMEDISLQILSTDSASFFEVGKLFITVVPYFIIDESMEKNPE